MYSLVVLLTVLRVPGPRPVAAPPRAGNLIAVAAVTGLLLYTHYWSLYLIGTMHAVAGLGGVAGSTGLAAGRRAVVGGRGGGLPDLPALAAHLPVPVAAHRDALGHAGQLRRHGQRGGLVRRREHQPGPGPGPDLLRPGRARACSGWPPTGATSTWTSAPAPWAGRWPSPSVGTLAAAIAGGFLTNSAFDARYASVVFIPLILLVAIGLITFRDRRVRAGILAVAVVAGLAGVDPQRDHQPDPGRPGGRGHRRPRDAGRRRGLLPRPAGPGGQPPPSRRPLPADHLPPGHRAGLRRTGSTTPAPCRRPRRWPSPSTSSRWPPPGRPDLPGVGPGVPDLRGQVRGDRPDPAGGSRLPGPAVVVGQRQLSSINRCGWCVSPRPGPDRGGRASDTGMAAGGSGGGHRAHRGPAVG